MQFRKIIVCPSVSIRQASAVVAFLIALRSLASGAETNLFQEAPPAWSYETAQSGEGFGFCVSSAGDVNGDGHADIIVGAPFFQEGVRTLGRAYLFHGSTKGLGKVPDRIIVGSQHGEDFGYCVAAAGDVNADGFDDVLIGAPSFTGELQHQGRALVYLGSSSGLKPDPAWTAMGATAEAEFGKSVASAGDVNGDGVCDIIVGAPYHVNAYMPVGSVYVYSGSKDGLSSEASWSYRGVGHFPRFGWSVAGAGDLNGDGRNDIVVGSPAYTGHRDRQSFWHREGAAYVFYGLTNGLPEAPDVRICGPDQGDKLGVMVSGAGDVNGDGCDELLLVSGASGMTTNRRTRAELYMGGPQGVAATPAWTRETKQVYSCLDQMAAPVYDINGDGFDDVFCGMPFVKNDEQDEGRVELYLGSKDGLSKWPSWFLEGNRPQVWLGQSFGSAGDVNGDGRKDVLISTGFVTNGFDKGRVFLWTDLKDRLGEAIAVTNFADAPRPSFYIRNHQASGWLRSNNYENAHSIRLEMGTGIGRLSETERFFNAAAQSLCSLGELESRMGSQQMAEKCILHALRMRLRDARRIHLSRRWVCFYQLEYTLTSYWHALYSQGKYAMAQNAMRDLERTGELAEELRKRAGAQHEYGTLQARLDSTILALWQLYADCRLTECIEQAKTTLKEANNPYFRHQKRELLRRIAESYDVLDDTRMAIEFYDKALKAPATQHQAGMTHSMKASRLMAIVRRDGVDESHLQEIVKIQKDVQRARNKENANYVAAIKAEILFKLERYNEALKLSEELLKSARKESRASDIWSSLGLRARVYLKRRTKLEEAEKACLEQLSIIRALGQRSLEIEVYATYGDVLRAMGRYNEAVHIYNIAFVMSERLGLPNKSVARLIDMLELYIEIGNYDEAARVWGRLQAYVKGHSGLSRTVMDKYRKAQGTYKEFIARKGARPEDGKKPLPEKSDDGGGEVAEVENPTDVDGSAGILVKPEATVTQVREGERARTRVILFNGLRESTSGKVGMAGIESAEWLFTNGQWRASLNSGKGGTVLSPEVELPAGQGVSVFLETEPLSKSGTNTVELSWLNSPGSKSVWEYSSGNSERGTEVVSSSFEVENPFYHTALYHEIYYRGSEDVVRNLRIEASLPCRIELLNSSTGHCMAIDANGDGDYGDKGDLMYHDLDGNNAPDLFFNKERKIDAVELLVFPVDVGYEGAAEIVIDIYVENDGDFELQGSDVLKLK